jgi:hypothetical protein
MTNENKGLALFMEIGAYEGIIQKYANPNHCIHWGKYKRLKTKILQWQRTIA